MLHSFWNLRRRISTNVSSRSTRGYVPPRAPLAKEKATPGVLPPVPSQPAKPSPGPTKTGQHGYVPPPAPKKGGSKPSK